MKRDSALVPLSHDHHQALFAAHELRRADEASAERARSGFLEFWRTHGEAHFEIEEQILFPAFAGHGDAHHPLLARALCDHAEIRHRARAAAATAAMPDSLRVLGERLADHVRLEERELFPLIEAAIPDEQLATVGAEIAEAEAQVERGRGRG